jgi:hypothetical protein
MCFKIQFNNNQKSAKCQNKDLEVSISYPTLKTVFGEIFCIINL